ncbi:MAG TPA: hypothetical protein VGX48_27005 [Pyrinomonadaceae bacterium]|jgi:hypothetical protein|nr:hypothetical protein [Pyrinomonadaceae bacterium]
MSDYLWDKTGETDAEVERLEELLGAFAHEPRPLELPAEGPRRASRTRPAWLAVAAALLLALLAGAFVALRRPAVRESQQAASQAPAPAPPADVSTPAPPVHDERVAFETPLKPRRQHEVRPKRKTAASAVYVKPAEEKEGEGDGQVAASLVRGFSVKAQLVNALRLTGTKLKEVQRKTLGSDEHGSAFAGERNGSR